MVCSLTACAPLRMTAMLMMLSLTSERQVGCLRMGPVPGLPLEEVAMMPQLSDLIKSLKTVSLSRMALVLLFVALLYAISRIGA